MASKHLCIFICISCKRQELYSNEFVIRMPILRKFAFGLQIRMSLLAFLISHRWCLLQCVALYPYASRRVIDFAPLVLLSKFSNVHKLNISVKILNIQLILH